MYEPAVKVRPGQRKFPQCSAIMGSRAKVCQNPECKFTFPKKTPPPVKVKPGQRFCPECFNKGGSTTILASKKRICPICGYRFQPKTGASRFAQKKLVEDFVAKFGGGTGLALGSGLLAFAFTGLLLLAFLTFFFAMLF